MVRKASALTVLFVFSLFITSIVFASTTVTTNKYIQPSQTSKPEKIEGMEIPELSSDEDFDKMTEELDSISKESQPGGKTANIGLQTGAYKATATEAGRSFINTGKSGENNQKVADLEKKVNSLQNQVAQTQARQSALEQVVSSFINSLKNFFKF